MTRRQHARWDRRPRTDAAVRVLQNYLGAKLEKEALSVWDRSLAVHLLSPQARFKLAMRAVLRRRAQYGGRKGRRAARRLRGAQ